MPTSDQIVGQLATRQHGHITRRQALDAGMTASAIDRRLRSGRWIKVHSGVYRIAGVPLTWEGRAMAAALSSPAPAVVSHACAAHLWGLEGFGPPGVIDITVERHEAGHPTRGVRIHESLAFHLIEARTRKGVPVPSPARTLLDVCAVVDDDFAALRALDCIRRRSLASWHELWRCLVLHAARGRNGITRYRRIMIKRAGKRVPDQKIAAIVLDLILDHGLPEAVAEHWVAPNHKRYRIDLAYPELKIAIECDGKLGHLNDAAFESDPRKRNALELDGWMILQFTWARIRDEPAAVVQEIREAIALRSG